MRLEVGAEEQLDSLDSSLFNLEFAPEMPRKFVVGEQVTRENFCSLLINSFGNARGDDWMQLLYMMWVSDKSNFDFRSTMGAFYEAGAWDCFSRSERISFRESCARVACRGHRFVTLEDDGGYNTIMREVNRIAGFLHLGTHPEAEKASELIKKAATFRELLLDLYGDVNVYRPYSRY